MKVTDPHELGLDARKWADEFCRVFPLIDHGLMHTWFATCIETVSELVQSNKHKTWKLAR